MNSSSAEIGFHLTKTEGKRNGFVRCVDPKIMLPQVAARFTYAVAQVLLPSSW
jgi:hypothetical protein